MVGRIEDAIREGAVIGTDETPVKVLDHPKTGKDGHGYMWPAREVQRTNLHPIPVRPEAVERERPSLPRELAGLASN